MKNCLICQDGTDQASLIRIPVSLEGSPLGDFLVCRDCVQLLGQAEVATLVRTAAFEKAYSPSQIIFAPGRNADGDLSEASDRPLERAAQSAPRSIEFEIPAEALNGESNFGAWLGERLAPLLLGQYSQGRGQVTLLTSLTQDGSDGSNYRFRAVLGD
jgi:hypothetical protein